MQKFDNVKTKAIKKFISIAIVFLLISTIFAYSAGSKGILSNIASNLKEKLDDFKTVKDDNQTKETLLEKTKDKIANTVAKINELKPKLFNNRFSLLKGFINLFKIRRASPTGTLFSIYTNYSGNELTIPIRSGIPKAIDVDEDGDNDVRVSFRIYSRIERPLTLSININFKIDRLVGFQDPYEFFETRLEFYLPGFLNQNNSDDRITLGYQSLKEDEVPDLCHVTYKYLPYLLKKDKPKHSIGFDPGVINDKEPLALIFGYDNALNNTMGDIEYSSKSKWTILLDPVIKTDISFGGSDDYVGRQFIFNSSDTTIASILCERTINNSKFNAGLLINPISSFSFDMEVTPFKKGGGRIEYIRNSSEPVNVTLFFENNKSSYIYFEGIPNHIKLSWILEKDGIIELNTFDDRLQTAGISDTKPGSPYFNYKAFLDNLPSLAFIKWNWQLLNGGEIDVFCDQANVSLYFIANNLLGAPLEISAVLTTNKNINMSFFWNFSLKSFGIRRTEFDINLDLHTVLNNSILFNFSCNIKNTINGPFEIVFGKLLDGDVNISFTSNILELSNINLEGYIPSVGELTIKCSEMIFAKENSGIEFGLYVKILGKSLTLNVALEIFDGILLHGVVFGFNEFSFPIRDIDIEGHQLYKFSFSSTIAEADIWISEDRSRGYANVSGGISLSVDTTFERPAGTKIGRIAGSINFEREDGFLNISFNTVNETPKFYVQTKELLVISDLQFWIKDKIDFKIPLIFGDFNINMLDKKGEVKFYLSPSSLSIDTNFSIDIKNVLNVTLGCNIFFDLEAEASGFIGFNWSDGKIKYFSGEGLAGLEGEIGFDDFYFNFDQETGEGVYAMIQISASKLVLSGALSADFSFEFLNITTPGFEIELSNAGLDTTFEIDDFLFSIYYRDSINTFNFNLLVDVEIGGSGSLGFKVLDGKIKYISSEALIDFEGTIIVYDSYFNSIQENEEGGNNKFDISVGELVLEGELSVDFSIGFLNITQPEFVAELENFGGSAAVDVIDFSIYFYNSTNKNFIDLGWDKLHFGASATLTASFEKKYIELDGMGEFSLEELFFDGYVTFSNWTVGGNIGIGGAGKLGGNLKIDFLKSYISLDIFGDLYFDVNCLVDLYNESHGYIEINTSLYFSCNLDGVGFKIYDISSSGFIIVLLEGKFLELTNFELQLQFSIINETGAASLNVNLLADMLYIDGDLTVSISNPIASPLKISAEGEGNVFFSGLKLLNCSGSVVNKLDVSLKVMDVVISGSGQFNAEIDIKNNKDISVDLSGNLHRFGNCKVNFVMDINNISGIENITVALEDFEISGPVIWSLTGENLENGDLLCTLTSSADDRVSIGKLYFRDGKNNSLKFTNLNVSRKATFLLGTDKDKGLAFFDINAEGSASWNLTTHLSFLSNIPGLKKFQNFNSFGSVEGNFGVSIKFNYKSWNISGDLNGSADFSVYENTFLSIFNFKIPLLSWEIEMLRLDVQPGYFSIDLTVEDFRTRNINEKISIGELYIRCVAQLDIDILTIRTSENEFTLLPISLETSNSFLLVSWNLDDETFYVEGRVQLEVGSCLIKTPEHELNISLYGVLTGSFALISWDLENGTFYIETNAQLDTGFFIKTEKYEFNISLYVKVVDSIASIYLVLNNGSLDLKNSTINIETISRLEAGLLIKTKEHELNFTIYLEPGDASLSVDLDNGTAYFETTSQLEFGFSIKTNKREFRLVDAILHKGSFSLYWNIIDKGHVEFLIDSTGTVSPEISLIYIKNLITGNSIKIAYVTVSARYIHYKHDIDILSGEPDYSGFIYLDTDGNPLLVGSLKICNITIFKGSLRAFDFNISWNFNRSNENWKLIDHDGNLDGNCIINVYILDAWRRLWPIGSQAPEMDANFIGNIDINNMKPGDKFKVLVFDPSTNPSTPISGAIVHYQEKTGPFTWKTYMNLTTGANGKTGYFTARIPPGNTNGQVDCRILATHENYSLTKMIFHVSSTIDSSDLVVSVSYNGDKLFEFEQFTVTVKNSETSSALQGATVYYRAYNDYGGVIHEESGTTNSNGKVVFTAIEVPYSDEDGQISCAAFAEKENFNSGVDYFVIWDTTADIHGYVYDGEYPIEGLGDVTVTAIDQSNPNNKYVVKTMNIGVNKGFYSLEVDSATYKIIYSKTGYQTEIVYDIIAEAGDYINMPKIYLYPDS